MTSKFLVLFLMVSFCFSCSNSTRKTFFIADAQVECVGVGPQQCLQIKEEGKSDWTYFYNSIDGFDYEEGFFYKIKVEVTDVENPPADASSLEYKLIEIIEKSKTPLNLDQGSWLVTRLKDYKSLARNPFIKIDLSKDEISGNTSCNRFAAKIVISNHKIAISELSSTDYLCKTSDVESTFLTAINSISSYTLNKGKLQLLDENQQLLIECDYVKND